MPEAMAIGCGLVIGGGFLIFRSSRRSDPILGIVGIILMIGGLFTVLANVQF